MPPDFSSKELLKRDPGEALHYMKTFHKLDRGIRPGLSERPLNRTQRLALVDALTAAFPQLLKLHGVNVEKKIKRVDFKEDPPEWRRVNLYLDAHKYDDLDNGRRHTMDTTPYTVHYADGTREQFILDIAISERDFVLRHLMKQPDGPIISHMHLAAWLDATLATPRGSARLVQEILKQAPLYFILRRPMELKPLGVSIHGTKGSLIQRVGDVIAKEGGYWKDAEFEPPKKE